MAVKTSMLRNPRLLLLTGAAFLVVTGSAADARDDAPTLERGAIEVGVDGSMVTTEGIVQGAVMLRGGFFFAAPGGLGGIELEGGYSHVSSLDATSVEAVASWQRRLGETGNYPYVSVGGGLRHDDIGSFSQTLFPFGFSVGLRALFGQRAAFRAEYRFRRVLNDPSADFSEQQITVGLSMFFRNRLPQATQSQ